MTYKWRGGRVVECDGLENRYSERSESRVRIPPSPPKSKKLIQNIKQKISFIKKLEKTLKYLPITIQKL